MERRGSARTHAGELWAPILLEQLPSFDATGSAYSDGVHRAITPAANSLAWISVSGLESRPTACLEQRNSRDTGRAGFQALRGVPRIHAAQR
jgi:hypothetical protein